MPFVKDSSGKWVKRDALEEAGQAGHVTPSAKSGGGPSPPPAKMEGIRANPMLGPTDGAGVSFALARALRTRLATIMHPRAALGENRPAQPARVSSLAAHHPRTCTRQRFCCAPPAPPPRSRTRLSPLTGVTLLHRPLSCGALAPLLRSSHLPLATSDADTTG